MRDNDRVEKLAKAIEEMVQGRMPDGLDDEELDELLQIAKIRLDAARLAAEASSEAQSTTLERIIARLNLHRGSPAEANELHGQEAPAGDAAIDDAGPEPMDFKGLQDIIGLRREIAEHAAAISESHRDAVWQRVQARIQADLSEKPGFFRWPFRRRDREAVECGAALDRMILGEPIWEAEDSRLEELLQVSRLRMAASLTASSDLADKSARVWAHLRPRLMARVSRPRRPRVFRQRAHVPWRKLAVAAAAVGLVVTAVGPIPATGFAHHPAAELVRFLGGQGGVSETSTPPAVPPVTQVVKGNDATAAEAGALLGLSVYEPTFVPDGYEQASSQYFPKAITSEQGGLFVLAYEGSGNKILVYQERATSNSIAVERGFAQDIVLSAGVPATYVSGSWGPVGSDLVWGADGGQSLLFDIGELRTVIFASDGNLSITELSAIADSLARQVAPPTS